MKFKFKVGEEVECELRACPPEIIRRGVGEWHRATVLTTMNDGRVPYYNMGFGYGTWYVEEGYMRFLRALLPWERSLRDYIARELGS